MLLKHLVFFEISFTMARLVDLVHAIVTEAEQSARKQPKALMVVSMQDIIARRYMPKVAAAFTQFDVFTPDGMPLVWLARLLGGKTDRLYGPDIFEAVLAQSEHTNVRHFFYGADQKTIDSLVKNALLRWPKLKISGAIAPPFRMLSTAETNKMVAKINAAKPSIVWLGLGSWKQLLFAAKIKQNLTAQYLIPVGMAFDLVAQTKQQAPMWMQLLGLEWLFRLIQEPTRLWRRYIFSVPMFALWWLQELVMHKLIRSNTRELNT